jgi:predicted MFS family arabinose efflux permease
VTGPAVDGPERTRFRDVIGVGEFRALWIAQAQSQLGDQLARLALALLVFDRTSSAVLTALVYSLTFLPPLFTSPLLSGLADRFSRRTIIVVVDLVRGCLVAVMVIPALPLAVVMVALTTMVCLQPLFAGARNAALPEILAGDRYQVGMGIVAMTDYVTQIIGFAGGGLVMGLLGGPRVALGIDALSFLASACLIGWGLGPHRPTQDAGARGRAFALAGIRLLAGDRRLAGLAGLIWLFGFFIAPEALAAPYAHELHSGSTAVGLLMAADPVGAFAGTMLITRLIPAEPRQRLMVPLALASGIPLVLSAVSPSLPRSLLLWTLNGVCTTYLVLAQANFTVTVPNAVRARAIGVASAGLQTAQGLGVLLAGAIAEVSWPSLAVAVCGAAGAAGAAAISLLLLRPRGAPTGQESGG